MDIWLAGGRPYFTTAQPQNFYFPKKKLPCKKLLFMKKLLPTILLCSFIIFLACNQNKKEASTTQTTPTFDLAKAKADIEAARQKFSDELNKGDSTALASNYLSNACICPPNMEACMGTTAVTSLMGGFIRMGAKDLKFTVTDLTGNADLLVESGTYAVTMGKDKDKGKYVVAWKNDNGSWKIYRDIWNSDMPMPTQAK